MKVRHLRYLSQGSLGREVSNVPHSIFWTILNAQMLHYIFPQESRLSYPDEMFVPYKLKSGLKVFLVWQNPICLHFREQTNKRRVKEIVKEFSLLCRGLQGAAY